MISAKTTEEERELTRVDQVEAIVVDVLVPWLVRKARAPEPGWENTQMGSQERVEGLKFLASLVQVKKDWRLSVASTPEYAALRLAQFDLKWEGAPSEDFEGSLRGRPLRPTIRDLQQQLGIGEANSRPLPTSPAA